MIASTIQLPLAALAAIALSSGPAAAADLLGAGTIGEVLVGDSHTGGFVYFGGICLAPIHSLAADDAGVYAGDSNGGIIRLHAETGVFMDLFWVPGSNATDIVVHAGHLLVSSTSGAIDRVDPLTGDVLMTLASPIQVQAMFLDGDDLYVAGTIGEVYRGSAWVGGFEPFAGICLAPVQALAMDGQYIYAGDLAGGIARFDRVTGDFLGVVFVPGPVTGMARDGQELVVANGSTTVRRVNPHSGAIVALLPSPDPIDALEILPVLGDLDGDGAVGVVDLLVVLGAWGPCSCPADLDGDGTVGVLDLLLILAAWG